MEVWPLLVFIMLELGVVIALMVDPVVIACFGWSLSQLMVDHPEFAFIVFLWLVLLPVMLGLHLYL